MKENHKGNTEIMDCTVRERLKTSVDVCKKDLHYFHKQYDSGLRPTNFTTLNATSTTKSLAIAVSIPICAISTENSFYKIDPRESRERLL